MKITDRDVFLELNIKENTYYGMKKAHPERVALWKLGLLAKRLLNEEIFKAMIKPPNKKATK